MTLCLNSFVRKKFSEDASLNELCINGVRSVSYYSNQKYVTKGIYNSNAEAVHSIQLFSQSLGFRLDPIVPCAGGVFERFFRWHAVIPPASFDEPIFSIRRHNISKVSLDHFDLDLELKSLLSDAIKNTPIVIYGDTGSGKTTFLMSLLNHYCEQERVIFVEQIPEINLYSSNWVRINSYSKNILNQGGATLVNMVEHALRLRPERLVIGEVRKTEMEALMFAMRVGHRPILWTMHAKNVGDIRNRMNSTLHQNILAIKLGSKKIQEYHVFEL